MLRLIDLVIPTQDHPPACGQAGWSGSGQIPITGLTSDSRRVEPGFLFAALTGARLAGTDFIADAIGHGAAAVLAPPGTALPDGAPAVLVEDALPRRRFARMAAAFYGAQPGTIVAVTGTSGKSSTVSFARQLWNSLGLSAASIGTLGIESGPINRYGGLTTADPVELHADLAALATAGVTHAAMEASSHGLDQHRLDGVRLAAAGFTGFGRDHLDYHATSAAYLAAKLRLFTELLPQGAAAVINADMAEADAVAAAITAAGRRVLTYGRKGRDVRIVRRTAIPAGQSVRLEAFGAGYDVEFPLVGEFQLMNALCALGLVGVGAPDFPGLVARLASLCGVRGRLEHVATLPNGGSIYVDYAHKPDALVAILHALRPHATGRLVVAFGCGGDRDSGKRPLMGAIAARLADLVIVTDDNPRSEDPALIRAAILAEAPEAVEIGDRAEAIRFGIRGLGPGDVFVIAGKGHEQGQIVGSSVRPFDDAQAARDAVAEIAP